MLRRFARLIAGAALPFLVVAPSAAQSLFVAASTGGLWSSPSTWVGGVVPTTVAPGSSGATPTDVVIPVGSVVVMDVGYPLTAPLREVLISGTLRYVDIGPAFEFAADYIEVAGTSTSPALLEVGTTTTHVSDHFTLTLTQAWSTPCSRLVAHDSCRVGRLRVDPYGILDLHGTPEANPYALLAQTAQPTATSAQAQLTLDRVVTWPANAEIAIASTRFDSSEAETLEVDSVATVGSQSIVTADVSTPLAYEHLGAFVFFQLVDCRAEVVRLDRNLVVRGTPGVSGGSADVIIEGASDIHECEESETPPAAIAAARLSHVSFVELGRENHKGRYPVHYHHLGVVPTSTSATYYSKIESCVVRDSSFRAIAVHDTYGLSVENNVVFGVKGHAIYIESGVETDNEFLNNVVMSVAPVDRTIGAASCCDTQEYSTCCPYTTIAPLSDATDPSAFWITCSAQVNLATREGSGLKRGLW